MKKTRACCLIALTFAIWSHAGVADTLHKYGQEGAWIHADSGWVFPTRIGEYARVDEPYSIDGNNDVGVEYERVVDDVRTLVIVEVFSAQSAAEHATLGTARAAMERRFGALEEEQPFAVEGKLEIEGRRLKYEGTADTAASLYFLKAEQWVVNIRTSSALEAPEGAQSLDAFVRALPWDTLGSDSGFH
jgi:hypothetical protein